MARDPSHPDINDPWVVAARSIDAEAEKDGIKEVMDKYGADLSVVSFVAPQRAMRAVLSGTPRAKMIYDRAKAAEKGDEPAVGMHVELSPEERQHVNMLTAVYVEAMFLGFRAAQIEPGDYPEYTGPGSDISI